MIGLPIQLSSTLIIVQVCFTSIVCDCNQPHFLLKINKYCFGPLTYPNIKLSHLTLKSINLTDYLIFKV